MSDSCSYSFDPFQEFDDEENSIDCEERFGINYESINNFDISQNTIETPGMLNMQLNDNKAGMIDLNKEEINRIIYEASKGSKFFENELKKEQQMKERVESLKHRLSKLSYDIIENAEKQADLILDDINNNMCLDKVIIHIDMDAFYAAVEMRDNPTLINKPIAVGGQSMLSTSNYVARRYGVRAAMPGFIGKKLCPSLIIVPPNFDKYKEASKKVCNIFEKYDANYSSISLDEAFLDLTSHLQSRLLSNDDDRTFKINEKLCCSCQNFKASVTITSEIDVPTQNSFTDKEDSSRHVSLDICQLCLKMIRKNNVDCATFEQDVSAAVKEIRFRIFQETGLTASAGIGPNTLIAKIGSDRNKPNGQFKIEFSKRAIADFMKDLPIRKINGIGKVSEKTLQGLHVFKCSDLIAKRGVLQLLFSEVSFNHFMHVAMGDGAVQLSKNGERKSMSVERTFNEMADPCAMKEMCSELSSSLATDLSNASLFGTTVSLKLKLVSFELKTRSRSIIEPTQSFDIIFKIASELLGIEMKTHHKCPLKLRLMGVRMSNFCNLGNLKQSSIKDIFLGLPMKNSLEKNLCSSELSHSVCEDFVSVTEKYSCPICFKTGFKRLDELNSHIDECLIFNTNNKNTDDTSITSTSSFHNVTCDTPLTDTFSESCVQKCPICNCIIKPEFQDSHIDECLNKQVIRELVKTENEYADKSLKRLSSQTDLPHQKSKKRRPTQKMAKSIDTFFN